MIRLFLRFSIGSWAAAAMSIFTLPIITALVRPAEFGRASMFSLATGLLVQLVTLGADQAYARDFYSRAPAERASLLRDSIAVPLLLSLVVAIVVLLLRDPVGRFLFGTPDPFAAALLSASIVLALIERFAMLTLRMEQRAGVFSALRVLFAVATFAITLCYAVLVDTSFHGIAAGQVGGLAIVSLAAVVMARGRWRVGLVRGHGVRAALIYGIPFVPTFAAMWVVEGIDKVALRHFADFTQLGIFSAAYRFIALVSLVQAGFSTFWVPVSFDLFERDPENARATFSRAFQLMVPVLVLAGLAVLLAKDVIVLLFAADYRDAAWVMPFLLLVPMMYALSDISSGGINLARQPRWHTLVATAIAIVNVMLNVLLVPFWGALGAAVATGCSYLLFFALRTQVSQRLLPLDLKIGRLLTVLAAFVASCAAHSFAPSAKVTYAATAAAILVCGVLYRGELMHIARRLARWRWEPDEHA